MITPDLTSLSSDAGVVTWSAEARWRCSLGMARNNCSLVGSPALSPPKRVESLVLRLHCVASHIEKRLEFLQSILLGCGEITSLRGHFLLVRPGNHSLCREQSDKLLSMLRSIFNYKLSFWHVVLWAVVDLVRRVFLYATSSRPARVTQGNEQNFVWTKALDIGWFYIFILNKEPFRGMVSLR